MSILVVAPRAVPRIILSGCSDLWRRVPIMRCYGCWVTTLHDDEMIDNVPFSLPLSPTYQNTSKRNRETSVQLSTRSTCVEQPAERGKDVPTQTSEIIAFRFQKSDFPYRDHYDALLVSDQQ